MHKLSKAELMDKLEHEQQERALADKEVERLRKDAGVEINRATTMSAIQKAFPKDSRGHLDPRDVLERIFDRMRELEGEARGHERRADRLDAALRTLAAEKWGDGEAPGKLAWIIDDQPLPQSVNQGRGTAIEGHI